MRTGPMVGTAFGKEETKGKADAVSGDMAAPPKFVIGPGEPSQRERDEHEALGCVVFREWCKHCLASGGIGHGHERLRPGREGDFVEIVADCRLPGREDECLPVLVLEIDLMIELLLPM